MALIQLPPEVISDAVSRALREDLGRAGDITSAATIPADTRTQATIVGRRAGIVAGMPLAIRAFTELDAGVEIEAAVDDGTPVTAGTPLARIKGSAHAILAAERVALNFLGHLSGIASATAAFVESVKGTGVRITCTRKTTPGLRALEKYAVRCGGGSNHRFGLDDAVLIKDNHIAVMGGVGGAIERARAAVGHLVKIEVEIDDLGQLGEALAAEPDAILLDNMNLADLAEAVRQIGGTAVVEASGGVTIGTARAIAETGVEFISSGWITHSAPALDIAMDVAD